MNRLPTDVLYIISSFIVPKHYTLRTDIPIQQLNKRILGLNPLHFAIYYRYIHILIYHGIS
jgi:hypothetical protein